MVSRGWSTMAATVLFALWMTACPRGRPSQVATAPAPVAPTPVSPTPTEVARPSIVLGDATVAYRTGDLATATALLESVEGHPWVVEQPKARKLGEALHRADRWPPEALLGVFGWVEGGPVAFDEGLVLLYLWDPDAPNTSGIVSKLISEEQAFANLGTTVVLMTEPRYQQALEATLERHSFPAATVTSANFADLTGEYQGGVLLEDGVVRWVDVGVGFGHSAMVEGVLAGPRPAAQGPSPWAPPGPPPPRAADERAFQEEVRRSGQPLDTVQAAVLELGESVYSGRSSPLPCTTCHQADGKGTPRVFPPLVGQAAYMGDCETTARLVIEGRSGQMLVDDVLYDGVMPPMGAMLDDEQVAAVASYVRQSWGNDYGFCATSTAAAARSR